MTTAPSAPSPDSAELIERLKDGAPHIDVGSLPNMPRWEVDLVATDQLLDEAAAHITAQDQVIADLKAEAMELIAQRVADYDDDRDNLEEDWIERARTLLAKMKGEG